MIVEKVRKFPKKKIGHLKIRNQAFLAINLLKTS